MTNIFDYFEELLDETPKDDTLKELPVDSVCGQACKNVIDAAAAWIDHRYMALGDDANLSDDFNDELIQQTACIVEVLWRG